MQSTPKQSFDCDVTEQIITKEPVLSMDASFGIFGEIPIYVESQVQMKNNYNLQNSLQNL